MAQAAIGAGGEGCAVMLRPRRVLVVDDDAVVGRSITRVLAGQGYHVREALSGGEALEELDRRRYDLVFTDIRMPGIDGLEMTSRIRKRHPALPVLIFTGHATEAGELRARGLGVAGFLHKPLSPEAIVESAARALRERCETLEAIRDSALSLMSAGAAPGVAAPVASRSLEHRASVAKNLALFCAAPFIGLAYVLAFPFVGFWAIGRYGYRALTRRPGG